MNPLPILFFAVALLTPQLRGETETTVESKIQLEDLDLGKVTTGWGTVRRGVAVDGLPMAMGKQAFTHGIGVHAASSMQIVLDGKARRLTSMVGVNDAGGNEAGAVEFRILGDSKLLWKSGTLRKGEAAMPVDLAIDGIHRLILEVDPLGSPDSDHANWADAAISYSGSVPVIIGPLTPNELATLYPPPEKLIVSPGDTTYLVFPAQGSDANAGTPQGKPVSLTAWKSIAKINAVKLAPGDTVIIGPGRHEETLKLSGEGTAEKPVVIRFAPGLHEFGVENALLKAWFVSNSCDNPTLPRPVGILLENVKHFKIEGGDKSGAGKSEVMFAGRMIEIVNDHCEDVTYSGLIFDLKRPTVSEFRVLAAAENEVTIQVAEASTYAIDNGRFSWTGDLGPGWTMVQQATPEDGRCWRMGRWDPFASARAEVLGGGKVRLIYQQGNLGMIPGRQFQFRNITRDTVSAHNNRCRNIVFRDCVFHALTGMGIVSQFSENILFQRVDVVPPPGTIRTCPAWADAFHFSGCRGKIVIDTCRFSGLQDDPVNVHGTHLQIVDKSAPDQLRLRFMQPQTYGFAAFQTGDEIAVISHSNLRELPNNPHRKVTAVTRDPADPSGKLWLVTLDGPVPAFGANDVIDNLSWYPDITIRNCHVSMASCRGFLLTTRGKVLVEDCTFQRTAMAAILIEDDAEGWFESGAIRDMTLRKNRFIGCGIEINPQTHSSNPDEPVHENIRIEENFFDGGGISAKSTHNLSIVRNRFSAAKFSPNIAPSCSQVDLQDNATGANQ